MSVTCSLLCLHSDFNDPYQFCPVNGMVSNTAPLVGSGAQNMRQPKGLNSEIPMKWMATVFMGWLVSMNAWSITTEFDVTYGRLGALQQHIDSHIEKTGRCPATLIEASMLDPLRTDNAHDQYGHPLVYRCTGHKYALYSAGPDGVDNQGRGDDIQLEDYPPRGSLTLWWIMGWVCLMLLVAAIYVVTKLIRGVLGINQAG